MKTPPTSLLHASPGLMIDRQEFSKAGYFALHRRYQQLRHDPMALTIAWHLCLK